MINGWKHLRTGKVRDLYTNDENEILLVASDARMPLDEGALAALISDPIEFTGDARQQVARVVNRIEAITSAHPAAAQYKPGAIR